MILISVAEHRNNKLEYTTFEHNGNADIDISVSTVSSTYLTSELRNYLHHYSLILLQTLLPLLVLLQMILNRKKASEVPGIPLTHPLLKSIHVLTSGDHLASRTSAYRVLPQSLYHFSLKSVSPLRGSCAYEIYPI